MGAGSRRAARRLGVARWRTSGAISSEKLVRPCREAEEVPDELFGVLGVAVDRLAGDASSFGELSDRETGRVQVMTRPPGLFPGGWELGETLLGLTIPGRSLRRDRVPIGQVDVLRDPAPSLPRPQRRKCVSVTSPRRRRLSGGRLKEPLGTLSPEMVSEVTPCIEADPGSEALEARTRALPEPEVDVTGERSRVSEASSGPRPATGGIQVFDHLLGQGLGVDNGVLLGDSSRRRPCQRTPCSISFSVHHGSCRGSSRRGSCGGALVVFRVASLTGTVTDGQ